MRQNRHSFPVRKGVYTWTFKTPFRRANEVHDYLGYLSLQMAKIPVAKIEPHFTETQQEETHEGNQFFLEEKSRAFFLQLFESKICQWPPPPSTNVSTAPVGPSSLLHVRLDPLPFWCHRVRLGNRGRIQQNTAVFSMWRKNTRPSKLALSFYWDERYH